MSDDVDVVSKLVKIMRRGDPITLSQDLEIRSVLRTEEDRIAKSVRRRESIEWRIKFELRLLLGALVLYFAFCCLSYGPNGPLPAKLLDGVMPHEHQWACAWTIAVYGVVRAMINFDKSR
jgi:hypothetical protein